ncbi:MAG: hypothetical protein AB1791_17980 [Chloroflexota bacterium]
MKNLRQNETAALRIEFPKNTPHGLFLLGCPQERPKVAGYTQTNGKLVALDFF